jgi:ankyrin repeat protein
MLLDSKGVAMDVADLRHETPLGISLKLEHFSLCDFLLTRNCNINSVDFMNNTPLLHATFAGRLASASYILAHGGDVAHRNCNGESALHLACKHAHLDILTLLLDSKADINAVDVSGKTPLMLAVMASKHSAVQTLLKHPDSISSTINRVDIWGTSALMFAAMLQPTNLPMVELLLSAESIALDQQDRAYHSALMLACRQGGLDVALRLLQAGCNHMLTNINQQSALDLLTGEEQRAHFVQALHQLDATLPNQNHDRPKPQWLIEVNRMHPLSSSSGSKASK